MTSADLRALARVLGALLPQRGRGQLADDPGAVQALAAQLERTCLMAGMPACDAVMMAHSIAGFLHGWHRMWDGQEKSGGIKACEYVASPNQPLQPTPYSVRSFLASASRRG